MAIDPDTAEGPSRQTPVVLLDTTIVAATTAAVTWAVGAYKRIELEVRVTNGFALTTQITLTGLTGAYEMSEIYNPLAATVANYIDSLAYWFTGMTTGPGFFRATIDIRKGGRRTIDMVCRDGSVVRIGSFLVGVMADTTNDCTGISLAFTGSPNVDVTVRGLP